MQFIKALLVLLFLNLISCGLNAHPMMKRAIIIDTDAAFDDLLAIGYLLNRPELSIKAITISADGEENCEPALKNVMSVLRVLKQTQIPIACGRSTPLRGNHRFPQIWSRSQQLNLHSQSISSRALNPNAVALLKKILKVSKETVDIIALGPVTNLAELIKSPVRNKIHMVYLMGGAVHVPGNVSNKNPNYNNLAEWNLYLDPYAADLLFSSRVPITLVPLDATNQVPFSLRFYQTLKSHAKTVSAKFFYQLIHQNEQEIKTHAWYFWDVLTAAIATDPNIGTSKIEYLRVLIKPEETSGRIIVDQQRGVPIHVYGKIHRQLFYHHILQYLFS